MSRFWAAGGSSSSDDDSGRGGSSDSDDSSRSGSDDSDDNDNNNNNQGGLGQTGQQEANRWLAMSDDSSDEDSVRVVLSGKERFQEIVKSSIVALKKAMKLRDYYEIQTQFDTLSKAMIKNKQYLVQGVPRPLVRILVELEDYAAERLLDKAQFQKLSARQGRALNRMKLTFKKHNRAYQTVMAAYRANPVHSDNEEEDEDDDDLDENKGGGAGKSDDDSSSSNSSSSSSSSSGSSSDSSSDSDDDDKVATKKKKKAKDSDDDSDSDTDEDDEDDEWGSDSSSSSSDDDGAAGAYAQLKGRARWLKKNTVTTQKVVKDKEARARAREAAKLAAVTAAAHQEAVTATKSVLPEENLTAAVIHRRIQELAATRRGKDAIKQLRELEALQRLSLQFGPRTEIPVTMYVISAQFALQRTLDDCMETSTWKSCAAYLQRIANVLDEGYTLGVENIDASDILLTKTTAGGNTKMKAALSAQDGAMAAMAADETLINPVTNETETADERAERLRMEQEANMTEAERMVIPVVGSLSLHLSRLEEEYTKSLQKISHHSEHYITRLRDESKLVQLLASFQRYFERVNDTTAAAALAQLRIEHLYYRHDSIAKLVDKAGIFYEKYGEAHMLHPACLHNTDDNSNVGGDTAGSGSGADKTDFTKLHPAAVHGKPAVDDLPTEQQDFTTIISQLCQYVYKYGTDTGKTRAMVCQVYHHALHDRYTQARDLLLMSHLQDTIYDCGDVSTMVLFNRMMVTTGMCAFRIGRIHDAHQCLADICSGRVRELLAQGVNTSRFSDKSPEQEKAEKRRLVPYHQHINLDLLEACHLISAMLLEVPNMAGNAAVLGSDGADGRRRHRVISRTFRKFLDQYNHQVFTGPPEQTRDFVMKAASALMKGDWKNCSDLLNAMDVWDLVPGEGAPAQIATMLTAKVKLEGLRTYLFAFSAQYDSLSLSQLCGMFALTKSEVHSVVSKMMINRELFASWDQPTETIVLRKVEPSPLQVLALQFAEKAAVLVEANERLLDSQSGSYGYKDDNWKGDRDDRWRGGRGGGGGGNYRGRGGDNTGYGGGRGGSGGRGGGRSGGGRDGGNMRSSGGGARGGGGRGSTGRTGGGGRGSSSNSRGGGGRGRDVGGRGGSYGRGRY